MDDIDIAELVAIADHDPCSPAAAALAELALDIDYGEPDPDPEPDLVLTAEDVDDCGFPSPCFWEVATA